MGTGGTARAGVGRWEDETHTRISCWICHLAFRENKKQGEDILRHHDSRKKNINMCRASAQGLQLHSISRDSQLLLFHKDVLLPILEARLPRRRIREKLLLAVDATSHYKLEANP